MIYLKNIKTLKGTIEDIQIKSEKEKTIDGQGRLLMLPGIIDGHVHFRIPGYSHKEDWISGAKAAVAGGVTMVFDMPNTQPPCVDLDTLHEKENLIREQLKMADIPLRFRLYLGADKHHLEHLIPAKKHFIAVKIYMGSSTGGLIMADESDLERVFQLGAQGDFMIAVHAEDEKLIKENTFKFAQDSTPSVHSKIRDRKVAVQAAAKAIALAEKYSAQLFLLHISTKEEVDLVRKAKERQLLVYAETTPHHLFLSEADYAAWGTKIQVNPPVRTLDDQEALWQGIHDRTIDTIGSDHAPHTVEEKSQAYGAAPSGIPSIELMLPLLLNAVNEGKLTLEEVVHLTRMNLENIYNLPRTSDVVLVDMDLQKEVSDANMKTKCGWSPYAGRTLKGWPVYTILDGRVYEAG